jgi:hypothetical protein
MGLHATDKERRMSQQKQDDRQADYQPFAATPPELPCPATKSPTLWSGSLYVMDGLLI